MARVPQMDYDIFKLHNEIRESPSSFVQELEKVLESFELDEN
jgi:hypothetical protein